MLWAQVAFTVEHLLALRNSSSDRLRTGRVGESLAKIFLKSLGYSFIEKNYRSGKGEIDLVMSQGAELVFVEVKTRTSRYGGSFVFDSITNEQENKLVATARAYISEKLGRKWKGTYRFDAVGVVFDKKRLVEIRVVQGLLG